MGSFPWAGRLNPIWPYLINEKKIVVYDINGEPLENTSADEAVEEEEEVIEEGMADDVSEVVPAAGDVDENASPANVE